MVNQMLEDFAPPGTEKAGLKQGAAPTSPEKEKGNQNSEPTVRIETPKSNATPKSMQDAKGLTTQAQPAPRQPASAAKD